jgi:hypothetical protein
VSDGEQGRSYDVWRCPECLEQVDPPGHGDYTEPNVAGHYHEVPNADPDGGEPYDRWVPGERVRVYEHPTDGEATRREMWKKQQIRELETKVGPCPV